VLTVSKTADKTYTVRRKDFILFEVERFATAKFLSLPIRQCIDYGTLKLLVVFASTASQNLTSLPVGPEFTSPLPPETGNGKGPRR
jgi:hypothetical protein